MLTRKARAATDMGHGNMPHMQRWKMIIGADEVDAVDGRTFERRSPTHGEVVGIYPQGGEIDAARAIEVARRTFDAGLWPRTPAKTRAQLLRAVAERLRARAEELADNLVAELGKPKRLARGEVAAAADVFDYYAGLALDLSGRAYTHQTPDAIGLALREPVGVVGILTPWNFPLVLVSWKLAPALAAGCTAVCKPSHHTPGSTLLLARILLEAGVPPGVVNVVTSETDNGAVVGQAIAQSPLVDKIAFTGSTATGRKIMAAAAGTLKRISLELGGKSPNVVFADAPSLDAAVTGAFFGVYMNSGQVCQAGSRLLVEESIHDEFLDKLVAMTKKRVRLGDPASLDTSMGPLVSPTQLDRVLAYIESGQKSARLVVGGGRVTDGELGKGLFVAPTIFDEVPQDAPIAREEIFGPVLSVMTFRDADEALRIANDTMYGLAAAVWTSHLDTAMRFAQGVRAGTVWVNAYHQAGLGEVMPYGGFRQSGLGRELGHEGLAAYLETKSIHVALGRPRGS